MLFKLARINPDKTQVIECDPTGAPYVFDNGQDASNEAKGLNVMYKLQGLPIRVKVVRHEDQDDVLDENWRERERAKFASGEYQPVPWAHEAWFREVTHDQFPHLSKTTPGCVAFVANAEHGKRNRHTRMSVGRYLTKFCGRTLSEGCIRTLVSKVYQATKNYEIRFAMTAEEMAAVYNYGPNSCVVAPYNKVLEAQATQSLVSVYAAGDLAVAYVMIGELVQARALCWPEMKVCGRIYGDAAAASATLQNFMVKEGYHCLAKDELGAMAGAKLNRVDLPDLHVPHRNTVQKNMLRKPYAAFKQVMLPYLDHASRVVEREPGKFTILAEKARPKATDFVLYGRNGGHGGALYLTCANPLCKLQFPVTRNGANVSSSTIMHCFVMGINQQGDYELLPLCGTCMSNNRASCTFCEGDGAGYWHQRHIISQEAPVGVYRFCPTHVRTHTNRPVTDIEIERVTQPTFPEPGKGHP